MRKKSKKLVLLMALVLSAFVLYGCGGGGGGGAAKSTAPAAKATVEGHAKIAGSEDCSNVLIVAEPVSNGVTRTVERMLQGAKSGSRVAQKTAAETDGIYTTTTDDECAYTLEVDEGTYSMSAMKADTVAAQPQRVVARSAAAVVVDFDLVATGKVAGTATVGVAGTDVVIVYLDGTSYAAFAAGDGSYEISNVPVGTYTIVFTRAGTVYASNAGVEITAGATTNSGLTSIAIACVGNSDCTDYMEDGVTPDDYTADTCTDAGTIISACSYPVVTCIMDSECDDSNGGTEDTCVNPYLADAYCAHSTRVAGGIIDTETTWSLANSPVTVMGQIVVDTGVTLHIEAGVVVYFKYPAEGNDFFGSGYSELGGIAVAGTLDAVGTPDMPITFTLDPSSATYGAGGGQLERVAARPKAEKGADHRRRTKRTAAIPAAPTTNSGLWGGIYFTSGSSGSLQYANMRYPSYAIQVDGSSPTISNISIEEAGEKGGYYGYSYHIYAKTESGWQQVGVEHYGLRYGEKAIDVSGYLPDADGEYKVRIEQVGMNAAHIDSVQLAMGGVRLQPVSAINVETGEDATYKMYMQDNDVIDAHLKTFEVAFDARGMAPSSAQIVLNAREEASQVISGGKPFFYPRNMFYETVDSANTYSYRIGGSYGALQMDGWLSDKDLLPAPAFAELSTPRSGHPEGYAYGYMKNDGQYLYAALDFTPDNTYDGDADYAALHVKVGNEYRTFRVSVPETTYGTVGYTYTGAVNYQHKVYEFRIPLAEIGNPAPGQDIQYVFEAYGTSSVFYAAVSIAYADNFSMSDVSIEFGAYTLGSYGGMDGLDIQDMGTGPHTLTNISIKGAGYEGIYIYNTSDLTIDNLRVIDTQFDYGLNIDSSDNITCNDCSVTYTQDSENGYIGSSSNIEFTDCEFNFGADNGLSLNYPSGDITFTSCDFSFNYGNGVSIQGVSSPGSAAIEISDSRIADNCYGSGLYYSSYGYGESVSISNSNVVNHANELGIYSDGSGVLDLDTVYLAGNNGAGEGIEDMSDQAGTSSSSPPQYDGVSSVNLPQSDALPELPSFSGAGNCGYSSP